MTKAECFQELIKKVLGRDCELAPEEGGEDVDIQREGREKQGERGSNVDRVFRCSGL